MQEDGLPQDLATPPHSIPRLRPNVVSRERLLARLNEPQWRYVLLSAPAGFGKTTLALDWLSRRPFPAAWISLSPLDNEPLRLFAQIAARLASIDDRFAPGLRAAVEAHAPPSVLAARLLDDLKRIDRPMALILDDYHFIESPDIHRLMSAIPEAASHAFQLVVLSRVDPPFPLARLKLNGEALDIRERDLRFTSEETADFFAQTARLTLSIETAKALEKRTEGWVAGLQMAAISLRHESDVETFVSSFARSNLFVLDYLMEEVVQRQSPELQRFLLQTSILLRFDARLCRVITELDDAPRLLEEAEAANLFLIRLNEPRGWFRYHHLFSELLAEHLRRFHLEDWNALHGRASRWFEDEGDLASAFYHAGQASGHERLLGLMERHGGGLLDRSELATFSHWAERIPLSAAVHHPRFLSEYIWVRLLTERFADLDALTTLAAEAIEHPATPYSDAEKADLRGTIATQRAYALRLQGHHEDSVAATLQALSTSDALSLRNRGLLYFNLGRGQSYLGNGREALEAFEQAYTFNLQARTWYHVLGVPAYTASLVAQSEGLPVARDRLEAAMAFAAERRLHDLPAAGFQHNQLGRFLFLQDDLEAAETSFRVARQLGEAGSVHSVMSNAVAGLARVFGARKEFDQAHRMLSDLEMLVHEAYPLLYESSLETERALLALEEGDDGYLRTWCSAERRRKSGFFTTEQEAANLVLMRALLHLRLWDAAAEVIREVGDQATRRNRRLSLLIAQLGLVVVATETGRLEEVVPAMEEVLQDAASQRLVRPFHEMGEPARRAMAEVLKNPIPPAVRSFACALLQSGPAAAGGTIPMFRQVLTEPMTEREQEVLFHLTRPLSYQGVADLLFISHDTVKTHVKHIYAKLGVSSRAEAVERAREAGLALWYPTIG